MTADDYLMRGLDRWHANGDLDGAAADFSQAVTLNPGFAVAFNQRGKVRRLQGALQDALTDFNRAIALDRAYANAYYNRGILYLDMNDFPAAIRDWETCLALGEDFRAVRQYIQWAQDQTR
ncbi:MAG: tetratricopeptide repeat protein [bacterium]|nr:tetratricopeptide repeat protein [bacterium]